MSEEEHFLADWSQPAEHVVPVTNNLLDNLLELSSPPLLTPIIRPRPEECDKLERVLKRQRVVLDDSPEPNYNYLKLKSGKEFFFKSSDGENILTRSIEPNAYIRKLLSVMPICINERLSFLADFLDERIDSKEEEHKEAEDSSLEFELSNINCSRHPDHISLRDKFYIAYIREWRLKFVFKKLLILWRIHKLDARYTKDVDPITLSEPEKEIVLYNWPLRKKFVFDARPLSNLIESKLAYQEYGFPVPLYPVNPSTNIIFAYNELVEIYNQLKAHGELQWRFTTLRNHRFNKQRWFIYHKSALIINAIRSSILLLDTDEGRELLSDFIFSKMDDLYIFSSSSIKAAYLKAMIREPKHWYLEEFKSIAMLHYEAEHFGFNKMHTINAKCKKIFKKHPQFIKELEIKKII